MVTRDASGKYILSVSTGDTKRTRRGSKKGCRKKRKNSLDISDILSLSLSLFLTHQMLRPIDAFYFAICEGEKEIRLLFSPFSAP